MENLYQVHHEFETKIREHLTERGWDELRPSDLAKSIMIEGAELLELFQWDPKKRNEVIKDKAILKELRGELADVLIYSYAMAISLNLNVDEVIEAKLAHVEKKYPPGKVLLGREEILKIHKKYRADKNKKND